MSFVHVDYFIDFLNQNSSQLQDLMFEGLMLFLLAFFTPIQIELD